MKKTQLKDALRNVKKRIVSFVSIILVMTVGVGIFLASRFGAQSSENAANLFYKEQNYHDFVINSTKGITEDDVSEIRKAAKVTDAEGIISLDMTAHGQGGKCAVHVLTASQRLDIPVVISGRLPEKIGECAVTTETAETLNISEGGKITLTGKNSAHLKEKELTVTGIMRHPDKYRVKEVSTSDLLVSADSFDTDSLGVPYTGIIVKAETPYNTFTDEYVQSVKDISVSLSSVGYKRAALRYEVIKAAAEKSFTENDEKLADARKKLDEGAAELTLLELLLAGVEIKHIAENTELSSESKRLDSVKAGLEAEKKELDKQKAELDGTPDEIKENDEKNQIYKINLKLYEISLSAYESKLSSYNADIAAYEEKKVEYDKDGEELTERKKQLEDGKKQLSEKEAEYEKGKAELEDAKRLFNETKPCSWIVTSRITNLSYVNMKDAISTYANIGKSFAVLFAVIGVLVCYATTGKIIDEQKKLVGTVKALGFKKGEILGKYMIFGVGGSMLGAIFGILTAYFILQPIMLKSVQATHLVGEYAKAFDLPAAVICVVTAALIGVLATVTACARLLAKPAVKLINGEAIGAKNKEKPLKDGKKPRSVYGGLILRNIRGDKTRVLITIVSIAGCCTLLMIGFTLKMGFEGVIKHQFGEIMKCETVIQFDPDDKEAGERVGKIIDADSESRSGVYRTGTIIKIGSDCELAQITCADPDTLNGYYRLYDTTKKKADRIPDGGAVIFSRLAEVYRLDIGDHFSILDETGVYRDVTISGIYNNYAGRDIFMSEEYGKKIFGDLVKTNCYTVNCTPEQSARLASILKEDDAVTDIKSKDELKGIFQVASDTMNEMIYVMIILAGIMAAVVLLNLVKMQINQKKRELTVMRINGFTVRETVNYILRENILTTAAGLVLGLIVGNIASLINLSTVEHTDVQMPRYINLPSCVFSVLITLLFAAIVNFIALYDIRKLKLNKIE